MVLTRRQEEILDFIASFIEGKGYAPSIVEIQRRFKINSPATVHQHLKNLQEKGLINRKPNRHRSIEVVPTASGVQVGVRVPILGAIAAGIPIEPFQYTEMMSLPEEMVSGGDTFLLRVRGDSMIDDHIMDGDMVIVKKSESADSGQTVVALVDGNEATLKRFYPEDGRIRLQPANPEMEPMVFEADRVRLQGVVTGILRKFQ